MTDQVQHPTDAELTEFCAQYPPIAGGDDGAPAPGGGDGGGSQGADGGSGGLYDLSNVPEEFREHVAPHLKTIEGNVTKKFQEAAEYRKGWEPYEQLGVNQVPPEHMQDLLGLYDQIAEAGSYEGWLKAQAEQQGFTQPDGSGSDDLDLNQLLNEGQENQLGPEQIQEMVTNALQEHLKPITERFDQQDQNAAIAQEYEKAGNRLEELQKESGAQLDEKGIDRVFKLALAYQDDQDPVGAAFKEYQEMVGESESGLLKKKLDEPSPPQGPGGAPDTAPQPIKTFADADKMARERYRQFRTRQPAA